MSWLTLSPERQQEERDKVAKMTDQQIIDYAAEAIKGAAVLISRGFGFNSFDQKADAAYDEFSKRKKPNLYEIAYNRAGRDLGVLP